MMCRGMRQSHLTTMPYPRPFQEHDSEGFRVKVVHFHVGKCRSTKWNVTLSWPAVLKSLSSECPGRCDGTK